MQEPTTQEFLNERPPPIKRMVKKMRLPKTAHHQKYVAVIELGGGAKVQLPASKLPEAFKLLHTAY